MLLTWIRVPLFKNRCLTLKIEGLLHKNRVPYSRIGALYSKIGWP